MSEILQGSPTFDKPKAERREPLSCDHCGSTDVSWVKCKLICRNCRQIIKSCADL